MRGYGRKAKLSFESLWLRRCGEPSAEVACTRRVPSVRPDREFFDAGVQAGRQPSRRRWKSRGKFVPVANVVITGLYFG